MQVLFPVGTLSGSQAINTAYITSDNAGNSNSTATANVVGGEAPGDFPDEKWGDTEQIASGTQYWSIEVGNIGFSDIDNYEIIDSIPDSVVLTDIRSPEFTDLDHEGFIHYQRSDMPGTWILWETINLNNRVSSDVSDLGLPVGEKVTHVKLDLGTVSANGLYNPYIYPDSYSRKFVLYGVASSAISVGDSYTNCAEYSGTSNALPISDISCVTTDIQEASNEVTGGLLIMDLDRIERNTFSIGDTVVVGIQFASPGLMGFDVVGAVMSLVLPPGFEYIPSSWYIAWGEDNMEYQLPILETETSFDGREIVRFVFDSSHMNSFTIPPNGSWEGFRLNFHAEIDAATVEGFHEFEYYFNSVHSDPDNCDNGDAENYLNGYAPDRCVEFEEVTVARPPSSAGLQSHIEVLGTLDSEFSRYPDIGVTVPGGINDYRITLKNPNVAEIDQLIFTTVLPHSSDSEVLDAAVPRYSAWRPVMVNSVPSQPNLTVEYTTVTNPCRDELAGPNPTPFPTLCTAPVWSTTPPLDITTVTAMRFSYGVNLAQNDSLVVTWPMRAPVQTLPDTSVAWNSFGYVARNADTGADLLPAEPIKVGIELRPGNLPIVGDFVWNDINHNGIQDIGEPGIDGVLVELFHDVNNNGIQEPNGPDTLKHYTRSAAGGSYLFSDFDYGYYFLRFSEFPTGYNETHANLGPEALDSDGPLTEVMLFDNTIDNRDIDLGLYFGILPPLCGSSDTDGDSIGDLCDLDDDNDGILDTDEGYSPVLGAGMIIQCSTGDIKKFNTTTNSWDIVCSAIPYSGDIAVSPTGDIYVTDYISNSITIFKVNNNCTTTPVATTTITELGTGLAFLPDGRMVLGTNYLIGLIPDDRIFQVDITTGVISPYGLTGDGNYFAGDLIVQNDILYYTTTDPFAPSGTGANLYAQPLDASYNPTGAATFIGLLNPESYGFTVDANGNVLGLTDSDVLEHISLTTGSEGLSSVPSYACGAGNFGLGASSAYDANGTGCLRDTDGDGICDYLDTDSDNDGCPDAIEGAESIVLSQLINNTIDYTNHGGIDTDGVPNAVSAGGQGQGIGSSIDASIVECCNAIASGYPDNEGDSIADQCDLDDDNDGVPDVDEGQICETLDISSLDGTINNIGDFNAALINISGAIVQIEDPLTFGGTATLDEFGVNDDHETDSYGLQLGVFSSGSSDYLESRYSFSKEVCNFNARILDIDVSDALDIYGYLSGSLVAYTVNYQGSCVNYNSINTFSSTCLFNSSPASGGVNDHAINIQFNSCIDSIVIRSYENGSGIGGSYTFVLSPDPTCTYRDTDDDGISDDLDLDSDNDGILDTHEAGHGLAVGTDGRILNVNANIGANGLDDRVETFADSDIISYNISDSEPSPDGIYDPYELDSDDDTCFDVAEATYGDADDDGIFGSGSPLVDTDGLIIIQSYALPPNTQWQDPNIGICTGCKTAVMNPHVMYFGRGN